MFVKYNEMKPLLRDSFKGGEGGGWSRFLLPPNSEIEGSSFSMIAENTLNPGASIGYHLHDEDDELFVIIEGEGMYREDNEDYLVARGDMMLLRKGHQHGLTNTSDVPLRLLAVIAR